MGACASKNEPAKDKKKKKDKNFDDDLDQNRGGKANDYEERERAWDMEFLAWQQLKGPKPGEHPNPDHQWNIDPDNYEHDAQQ